MTNNRAEYTAVLQALRWCEPQGYTGADIWTDSRLVVEQINGRWRVKAAHLWPLCAEARVLVQTIYSRLSWIPREENTLADRLTRRAYEESVCQS
jgi:ribonuclease HI